MHISSVTVSGFQCFGTDPTTITFEEELTSLIGANSSGKTALLQALCRLFGSSQSERQIRPQDFFVPPEQDLDDEKERKLWIDVRIECPELREKETIAIAPFFQKVNVSASDPPFVRARLEATWHKDVTPEGSIEEEKLWVLSEAPPEQEVSEQDKQRMTAYERGQILVQYIPAQRNAINEVRRATGSIASQLIRAINWSEDTKETIEEAAKEIRKAAGGEEAMGIINNALNEQWGGLHDGSYSTNPTLHVVEQHFRDLVRTVDVSFNPSATGTPHHVDELSDGLQSLFYLSLLLSYHRVLIDVDKKVASGSSESTSEESDIDDVSSADDQESVRREAFIKSKVTAPSLVLLALEEPENHLAPYYLSRIINQLRGLTDSTRVQAILTSHSTSTLTRIEPEEVRHLRLQGRTRTSLVRPIALPKTEQAPYTYVRQAVQAYPELYFARFAVFGEGDSEEIVLPYLARALGLEFDPSFVAMVPLGGRHVNHFWRLVGDLGIPHATLLDLDIGRAGAGWSRIKYALTQLLEIKEESEVLERSDGKTFSRSDLDTLDEDHTLSDREEMDAWIEHLSGLGVFFSEPLDLDWSMLTSFQSAYQGAASNRPKGEAESAIKAVLKEQNNYENAKTAGFYFGEDDERFRWYRYLFTTKSKPATHLGALSQLSERHEIEQNMPDALRELLQYVEEHLNGSHA